MLDLRDIRIPWFPKKSKFSEILRATPRSISDRLVFSFSLRQASDLRSVIMLLASHPIVSISLDQAVEGIELRPDADKAQQTQFFQKIRSVTFSWNSVQQLPLDAFFSLLPQFSFSSLSTLSIVNPLLADADLRSLTYLLQSHNLPLYVLINDSPLHAVSSFQEQVAAVQQSSQQLVQSLKQELEATKTQVAEKTAELRGLVDANLALKQELGKLQEAAKEAAEAEGKRKAECETLIAQIGKLNSQAAAEAETAKGREENLTIALGAARETAEKVVHALQTLQTGFQQLVSSGAFQSGPLQWNVRNVSGAANFAINQLVELSKSVGTSLEEGAAGTRSPAAARPPAVNSPRQGYSGASVPLPQERVEQCRNHFLHKYRNHFHYKYRNHFHHKYRNHFLHKYRNHFHHKCRNHFLHKYRNHFHHKYRNHFHHSCSDKSHLRYSRRSSRCL
ncbi:hypothetical protein WA588_002654 [Blastocystis sp. NMH]